MGKFFSNGVSGTAAAPQTALTVVGATTVRPRIYDIIIGSVATPADAQVTMTVRRFTAAGTATAVTPEPIEGGGAVALATSGQTHSAEPTYAGIGMAIPIHQRGTFRWVARQGGELSPPLTAANGYGVARTANTTGTPAMQAVIHWEE